MHSLNILGIRGIPAVHGGFEYFAARFAPFMKDKGWAVTVYCQEQEGALSPKTWIDDWGGIRRVHFDTRSRGALATMEFDLRSTLHTLRQPGIDLVLGYNTAIFSLLQRVAGRRVVMNMDGIEWKRQKWGKGTKAWFWLNEWIGANFASSVIADHPRIADHLAARGCHHATVIPYGSDVIMDAPVEPLAVFGLAPREYFLSIARIEPENSILEIVRAFTGAGTGRKLIVLGKLQPNANPYHAQVKQAVDANVILPGAIYDQSVVRALRCHCLAYMHGHQVGGTNPSLVEALGAGSAVIAHDNRFNRWTAGPEQAFFSSEAECAEAMRRLSESADTLADLQRASRRRHHGTFEFHRIHSAYLNVIAPGFAEAHPVESNESGVV